MKRLSLLLLPTIALAATTTITQTVVGPDGQPASGTAYIRISAACKSTQDGKYVGDKTVAVRFVNGAFSTALVPNSVCPVSGVTGAAWSALVTYQPTERVTYGSVIYTAIAPSTNVVPGTDSTKWAQVSTSYTVSWTLTGGTQWSETWIVPVSATPVTVDSVKVAQANLPTALIPIAVWGLNGSSTWAEYEAGTAATGSIGAYTSWAQIEGGN